jgi:seryl-tRNA synthetase
MLASGQRDKNLKYEITSPISGDTPGAIASSNYHEDHFGVNFNIRLTNGQPAHSSCIGFGLERIALALLLVHGISLEKWPAEVRESLSLSVDREHGN